MALGIKTGGRKSGTPNRVTAESRRLVALLIEENKDKLSEWLNTVANGIKKVDPKTGIEKDGYILKPNPAKAFAMLVSVLEYSVPKLSRTAFKVEGKDQISSGNKHNLEELIRGLKRLRQSNK